MFDWLLVPPEGGRPALHRAARARILLVQRALVFDWLLVPPEGGRPALHRARKGAHLAGAASVQRALRRLGGRDALLPEYGALGALCKP